MGEPSEPPRKRLDHLLPAAETTSSADRISELPDVLLTQILSLLPTKQAVATGALSKRWRPFWASVPILDFDDDAAAEPSNLCINETTPRESNGFSEFVYSVLLMNEARPVTRFRLRCHRSCCSELDVVTWLCQAVRRGVKQLELSLSVSRYVALPRMLFNCDTVTTMRLDGVFLNSLMWFTVRLPSLKVLHVGNRVSFGSHDYVMKLLAGCPVLEDLMLGSNYSDLCGARVCTEGKFELNLSRMEKAKIGFSWYESCNKSMLVFFKALSNVRCLSISSNTAESLNFASASDMPVFNNLVELEISILNYCWDLLTDLLRQSSKLELLLIYKEPHKHNRGSELPWNHPPVVPECLLSHLKTFCFRDYQGLESETEFVGYLMQNARALETVTFYIDSSIDEERKLEIRNNLSILKMNFGSCQIAFH